MAVILSAREAISLAPWLQPGDNKPGMTRNRFNGFCWQAKQEKPLETVRGIIV
jgi:hypothetical protein